MKPYYFSYQYGSLNDLSKHSGGYMRKLTRLSLVLAIVWNIIVMILTPMLLPLYDLSPETKHLILNIVAIHNLFSALVQPFSGPLSSGLRAAGDVKFTMYFGIRIK